MIKRCIYCQSRSNVADDATDCPKCGLTNKLTPFVSTPMLNASTFRQFEAFESPSTGKIVRSMKEREYDMKSSGCRDWEGIDQEKKEAAKIKAREDQEFDNFVEQTAEQEFHKLPEETQQALL